MLRCSCGDHVVEEDGEQGVEQATAGSHDLGDALGLAVCFRIVMWPTVTAW